jgi:hypothetical protein
MAEGPPMKIAKSNRSYTGQMLCEALGQVGGAAK